MGLTYGSSSSIQLMSISPTSVLVGMWYSAKSWCSINERCTGCNPPSSARPSAVTISSSWNATASARQLLIRRPASRTVQAPHWPWSQPFLGELIPSRSRSASRSVVRVSTVRRCSVPSTLMVISCSTLTPSRSPGYRGRAAVDGSTCLREQLDLDPARTSLVEGLVSLYRFRDGLLLGENVRRVEGAAGDEADEPGDVAPVVAVAAVHREVAPLERPDGEGHGRWRKDPDDAYGPGLAHGLSRPHRRLRRRTAGLPQAALLRVRLGGDLAHLLLVPFSSRGFGVHADGFDSRGRSRYRRSAPAPSRPDLPHRSSRPRRPAPWPSPDGLPGCPRRRPGLRPS